MIRVDRRLNSTGDVGAFTDLNTLRGLPTFIRSDNDVEFIAKKVRAWIEVVGAEGNSPPQVQRGEMDIAAASTAFFEMSYSMERSSPRSA